MYLFLEKQAKNNISSKYKSNLVFPHENYPLVLFDYYTVFSKTSVILLTDGGFLSDIVLLT